MIRQATINDLGSIVKVHINCFPCSYLAQLSKVSCLGDNQLLLFYKEFIIDNPELFWVAEDENDGIVGFCMGYYMDKDSQIKNFMHKNRVAIAWKTLFLLLACNKYVWRKMIARIKHKPTINDWTIVNNKYESLDNTQRGDLLSVCVLPKYRSTGYAQKLMEAYLKSMKNNGRKICLLSVKQDNKRAIKYYERNGFELYRTRGNEGYTYIKLL